MPVARLPAPVRGAIPRGLRSVGYELVATPERAPLPPDLAREQGFVSACARSRQFTMTPLLPGRIDSCARVAVKPPR